ncbi:conserved hypothetical protein [Ricinus communis]|uniref:Uncharacterized protein n=1 Tax=Ricinus communis TaxID=3988 RepID=B9T213_RICCO|nr:conserved hypothetical protein [Ricinus communis]
MEILGFKVELKVVLEQYVNSSGLLCCMLGLMLWSMRNISLFGKSNAKRRCITQDIRRRLNETLGIAKRLTLDGSSLGLKLNTDGAPHTGTGMAKAGRLIRDLSGRWIIR